VRADKRTRVDRTGKAPKRRSVVVNFGDEFFGDQQTVADAIAGAIAGTPQEMGRRTRMALAQLCAEMADGRCLHFVGVKVPWSIIAEACEGKAQSIRKADVDATIAERRKARGK
jgi:hypothetical protein